MCANQQEISCKRMRQLIEQLNEADVAYYRDDRPVITDREYDAMMEELQKLEAETGVVLSGSPTQRYPGKFWKN